MSNKRIGLALSGGGARGLAHIGVLKILDEAGIPISFIGGSSMGGIVAALYASGMSPVEIESAALNKSKVSELIRLADPTALRRGLFEGQRIRSMLAEWIKGVASFDQLRIPLVLCAVDLNSAREIAFKDGELLPIMMATSAFPGVFAPVNYLGYHLVDGGVLNNLPVDRVRELGADLVIAVDVLFQLSDLAGGWHMGIPIPGMFEEFYRAEMILQAEYSRMKLEHNQPEVYISPVISPEIGIFTGFPQAQKIITAGEHAAQQVLPLIKHLL